jgi:hypothetical protein
MKRPMKKITIKYENGLEVCLRGAVAGNPVLEFHDVEDGEIFSIPLTYMDASVSDTVQWWEATP